MKTVGSEYFCSVFILSFDGHEVCLVWKKNCAEHFSPKKGGGRGCAAKVYLAF
jgi:hypothetical protein